MKALAASPTLVERVHDAIVAAIADGTMKPGERIIQEQIAHNLGVSRQPVQQALLLLRTEGLLQDAPARGLIVAPIDLDLVANMYDIRASLEGLAFRRAAERGAARARKQGPALIERGRKAVRGGAVGAMIDADIRFHDFIHALSANPLIATTIAAQWTGIRRVMGEVLMRDDKPRDIWDQHEALLQAVADGDADRAEALARAHITQAAAFMIERLRSEATARAA